MNNKERKNYAMNTEKTYDRYKINAYYEVNDREPREIFNEIAIDDISHLEMLRNLFFMVKQNEELSLIIDNAVYLEILIKDTAREIADNLNEFLLDAGVHCDENKGGLLMKDKKAKIGIFTCDGIEEDIDFFADIFTGKYYDEIKALLNMKMIIRKLTRAINQPYLSFLGIENTNDGQSCRRCIIYVKK